MNGNCSVDIWSSVFKKGEEIRDFTITNMQSLHKLPCDDLLTLSWRDVSVSITKKKKSFIPCGSELQTIQILKKVTGIARSGQLTAIMGASGSGKTTLLATISKRIKVFEWLPFFTVLPETTQGEILINGREVSSEMLRSMSGFVPQNDLVVNSLTVSEHIKFMSHLKKSRRMATSELQNLTQNLLTELSLKVCENTRISNLSGGEKRRLCLAVQLLTDPAILFCDEPTTGLDSYNAAAVINKLKQLSARGMAVICTIHQPASGIFELFHELTILAEGRVAYQGKTVDAYAYFSSKGLSCPETFSVADYYISQLAIKPNNEEESVKKVTWFCDEFEKYNQIGKNSKNKPCDNLIYCNRIGSYDDEFVKRVPCYQQLYWIMWRQVIDERRTSSSTLLRFIGYMLVGVLIAVLFMGKVDDDQAGIQNTMGLLYLIIIETIITYTYSVLNTFPQDIPILLREIREGLYGPGSYYVSKMAMMIPRCVVFSFIYVSMMFKLTGLNGGFDGLIALWLPVMMSAFSASAYGCMMSAMFESVTTASLLTVPIDLLTMNLSGLFLNVDTLPIYISWLRFVSQFYYANEALSIARWKDVTSIDCWDIPNAPCLHTGQEVLSHFGFYQENLIFDLMGLFLIYCFCHAVGYIFICKRSKARSIY